MKKLSQYPFSQLHQIILFADTSAGAAKHLGVNRYTLESYLGRFTHDGQPLSIKRLRELSVDTMRQTYANYDQPWQAKKTALKDYPFSYIHQIILATPSKDSAANKLGTYSNTLEEYLLRFTHDGERLSVYRLRKQLSADTMRQTYANYDQPWAVNQNPLLFGVQQRANGLASTETSSNFVSTPGVYGDGYPDLLPLPEDILPNDLSLSLTTPPEDQTPIYDALWQPSESYQVSTISFQTIGLSPALELASSSLDATAGPYGDGYPYLLPLPEQLLMDEGLDALSTTTHDEAPKAQEKENSTSILTNDVNNYAPVHASGFFAPPKRKRLIEIAEDGYEQAKKIKI